jgi:hypothetical protein
LTFSILIYIVHIQIYGGGGSTKISLHHDAWGMETTESPLSTLALEEPTKVHTPSVPKCLSLENRVFLTDTFSGRQTKKRTDGVFEWDMLGTKLLKQMEYIYVTPHVNFLLQISQLQRDP